jgi:hypothetical protein
MREIRPVFAESTTRLRVIVVIVLYRIAAKDAPAFRSVMTAREGFGDAGEVGVLLWENSPAAGAGEGLPEGVAYFADESNS